METLPPEEMLAEAARLEQQARDIRELAGYADSMRSQSSELRVAGELQARAARLREMASGVDAQAGGDNSVREAMRESSIRYVYENTFRVAAFRGVSKTNLRSMFGWRDFDAMWTLWLRDDAYRALRDWERSHMTQCYDPVQLAADKAAAGL